MGGLNKLTSGDNSEKLRFLFKVYDVDGKYNRIFLSIAYSLFLKYSNSCNVLLLSYYSGLSTLKL